MISLFTVGEKWGLTLWDEKISFFKGKSLNIYKNIYKNTYKKPKNSLECFQTPPSLCKDLITAFIEA